MHHAYASVRSRGVINTIMAPLVSVLKHCHLGSNPMRLILCGQEVRRRSAQ